MGWWCLDGVGGGWLRERRLCLLGMRGPAEERRGILLGQGLELYNDALGGVSELWDDSAARRLGGLGVVREKDGFRGSTSRCLCYGTIATARRNLPYRAKMYMSCPVPEAPPVGTMTKRRRGCRIEDT